MSQMSFFLTLNLVLSINKRTMPTPNAVMPDLVADTWNGEKPASLRALDEIPMQAQRKQPARINMIATDLLMSLIQD